MTILFVCLYVFLFSLDKIESCDRPRYHIWYDMMSRKCSVNTIVLTQVCASRLNYNHQNKTKNRKIRFINKSNKNVEVFICDCSKCSSFKIYIMHYLPQTRQQQLFSLLFSLCLIVFRIARCSRPRRMRIILI